jgi:hypothetical protein
MRSPNYPRPVETVATSSGDATASCREPRDAHMEAHRAATAAMDRAFCTARAKLALLNHELHILSGDGGRAEFQVQRWGFSKVLPDMDAVEAFLRQVGGTA